MSPSEFHSVSSDTQVFVVGSVNIDHLYTIKNLPSEGFCEVAQRYRREIGGKGLNQAFALFQAGFRSVRFVGQIGEDGLWIKDYLEDKGFPTSDIHLSSDHLTGNCVIMHREKDGQENAFMLSLGANGALSEAFYARALQNAKPHDILVVQNEVNDVSQLLKMAKAKCMFAVFNPAPIPPKVDADTWQMEFPTDMLVLNKLEAEAIAKNLKILHSSFDSKEGIENGLALIADKMCAKIIVMTYGEEGSYALVKGQLLHSKALKQPIVDTTGAGDTFLGYLLAELLRGGFTSSNIVAAMNTANAAAGISITQIGALQAIPSYQDVLAVIP